MYNSAMTTPTVRLAAARALGTTTRGYAMSPWASQQPPKGKRKIVLVGAGFVGQSPPSLSLSQSIDCFEAR